MDAHSVRRPGCGLFAHGPSDVFHEEGSFATDGADVSTEGFHDVGGVGDGFEPDGFVGLVAADEFDVAGVDEAVNDALAEADVVDADEFHLIHDAAEDASVDKKALGGEAVFLAEGGHGLTDEDEGCAGTDENPCGGAEAFATLGAVDAVESGEAGDGPEEPGAIGGSPCGAAEPDVFFEGGVAVDVWGVVRGRHGGSR